ncbi:MAG: hypothetical protein ACR2NT_09740 [Acidimicrobiia bacterium]
MSELLKEGQFRNAPLIEVLMVKRDNIQHFANYIDAPEARELYESVMIFASELMSTELGEEMPALLSTVPIRVPVIGPVVRVAPSQELQRDVNSALGLVVWSQGTNSQLAVYMLGEESTPKRITPEGNFEYMPRTDGDVVVCYRQSGGIILYDLDKETRTVISETGGPGDVLGQWVAAQGLDIEDGLGGGVWLLNRHTETWEQLSDKGDSPRLTPNRIIWQEHNGETMVIRSHLLEGGDIEDLIVGGTHPSPSGERMAWTAWGGDDAHLHVTSLDGQELYSAPNAIFPHLDGDLVAYLTPRPDGGYALLVDDIRSGQNAFELDWVGFPMGSGPRLSDGRLFFESRANSDVHAIWVTTARMSPD